MTVSVVSCMCLLLSYTSGVKYPSHLPKVINQDFDSPQRAYLSFTKFAGRYKLDVHKHQVVTQDGYRLRLFRVRKRGCAGRGPPVVLNHGLLLDAFCWITSGEVSPAVLIASTCVDLWLPNARGTRYSRAHASLSPSERAFWQFSVDEIGRYDLPAVVDYVLAHTGHTKLNYVGFSQGAGSFFIMCSELPDYCDKIGVMIALAPATRHLNAKSELFRQVSDIFKNLESVTESLGIYEVFTRGGPVQEALKQICPISNLTMKFCSILTEFIASSMALHPGSLTPETLKVMTATFPAGTSVHNLARYGQSLYTEYFQKVDYGSAKNMQLYGRVSPPVYNFSAVTVPVVVIYGDNDGITDIKDVQWTIDQLPNVLEASKVNVSQWNHFDMIYSHYFKDLVFPTIQVYLNRFAK